ncbi:hypothetical protein [Methylocapsa aurea]|uniref:hypothetical protein n=1 Tax=Methylocapsa aurea TaxID=663610 RepID=UPI003D188B4F
MSSDSARPETTEAQGRYVTGLRAELAEWRGWRGLAHAGDWPPLAREMIDIAISALEREIAECVRLWF